LIHTDSSDWLLNAKKSLRVECAGETARQTVRTHTPFFLLHPTRTDSVTVSGRFSGTRRSCAWREGNCVDNVPTDINAASVSVAQQS
jgi:hypothetical protein